MRAAQAVVLACVQWSGSSYESVLAWPLPSFSLSCGVCLLPTTKIRPLLSGLRSYGLLPWHLDTKQYQISPVLDPHGCVVQVQLALCRMRKADASRGQALCRGRSFGGGAVELHPAGGASHAGPPAGVQHPHVSLPPAGLPQLCPVALQCLCMHMHTFSCAGDKQCWPKCVQRTDPSAQYGPCAI